MTAAVLDPNDQSLVFAQSESKQVGFFGRLSHFINDNSARVVGSMKLVGDVFIGFSGNPWLIAYSVFSGLGRIMLITFGTKENQKKAAEKHKNDPDAAQKSTLGKVLHPREYPVETSAGLSTVAETLGVAFGASRFMPAVSAAGWVFGAGTGYTQLLLGALAVTSYATFLTGKDKKKDKEKEKQESLTFAKSESKPVGFGGKLIKLLKNSEVKSTFVLFALTGGLLGGAILEGYGAAYITGAAILLIANAIQTIFVRKKKFNIEGAQEEKQTAQQQPDSFKERVEQSRKDEPGVQLT